MKIYKLLFTILLFIQALNASNDLKKVSLQLSWFNQFQFAGYFIAKEKGFYKQVGLDINIIPFQFGVDTAKGISEGKYDFAIGRETLLLEKAKGKDIVALYSLFQSSPLILLSTKKSGIDTIDKFTNKTIMTTIDDASEVSLKAMILSNKTSIDKLNFIKHTHNINDLINKKTDVISAYISKSPYELEKMSIAYNIFAPKNYGFDMYSDFLITSEKLIKKDIKTVIKFKEASLKGWKYAYENIEESVNIILKKYNSQNISKEALIYEAKKLKELSYYKTKKLGDINLDKLQRIHDLYNIMGLLPKKVNLSNFYFYEKNFYNNLSINEQNFIKENNILTIGENENIKPINYLSDIGLHNGLFHDYLNLISDKTGLRFIPYIDTKKNLKNSLYNNSIDVLATSIYSDDNKFTNTNPYFKLHETSFQLKNKNNNEIKNIGILNYIKSNIRESIIKKTYPDVTILKYNSIEESVESLKNSKVDALFIPEELLLTYIKDTNENAIDYANINIETNVIPISLVLNKESKLLNTILSKAIDDISEEQHNAIRNKWIPIVFKNTFNWKNMWEYFFIVIIIISMFMYKQLSLRRIIRKLKENETQLKEANYKLKELSELDYLTKLYNRRYFENIADDILTLDRRENNSTSLLMFDIDDFKQINDTYGHKIGDEVLKELAKLLLKLGRKSDVISRIGGEEFCILLPNTCLEGATKYTENLKNSIENMIVTIDENDIQITVSMGLSMFDKDDNLSKVFVRADKALYISKDKGKNLLTIIK